VTGDEWLIEEATNQTVFREMNEWTRDDEGGIGDAKRGRDIYLCECGDGTCTAPILLTLTEYEAVRSEPTRFAIALDHARKVMAYETDPRGAAIEFRKHLGWYSKGLHGGAELRKKLYAVTSFGEVEGIFADYLANAERYAAATDIATESGDDGVEADAA